MPPAASRPSPSRTAAQLARRLGLRLATPADLGIARRRRGKGWSFCNGDGRPIRDARVIRRLKTLAVPPAYQDVLYAADPQAHLQAVGRDAAGRLQYRYHPDWEKVREARKSRRLARLAQALPLIRRAVGRALSADAPNKAFAVAAVIELVSCTAIRAGGESYTRLHGTRGATTLLKTNLSGSGHRMTLSFRAKGGKQVTKTFACPRLAHVLDRLLAVPGRRLFQYRGVDAAVHPVSAQDVNAWLRETADVRVSLKDFRMLIASANALSRLARVTPERSPRARRRQVLDALRATADDLGNTPAICRKSYVHVSIVEAFEGGGLERYSAKLKGARSAVRRAAVLAEVIAGA